MLGRHAFSWSARCRPRQRIQARVARATRFAEGRARREAPRDYYYYSVYLHYPTDYFKLSDYPTTTSNTIRLLLQILYFKYYPTDYFKYSVYHIITMCMCITLESN